MTSGQRTGAGGYSGRTVLAVVLPLVAGLALRVWMLRNLFAVYGDALVYGDLAKNLLLHGQFAATQHGGVLHPTLIRLPGYPFFVAACFRLFGMENYFAVACVQIALELAGCLLLAAFARRVAPARLKDGAALATLWLAALCPFTASYATTALTEGPTLFALALTMWATVRFREEPRWSFALWFTFAATLAAMLRPDGILAAVVFGPALAIGLRTGDGPGEIPLRRLARMAAVCGLLALAPFAVWTARNWRVFHVIQPLAPRLAIDPGESPNLGWEHWVKSWCLDFVSTFDIYWNVPGDTLEVGKLPSRAFDTPAQYAETVALAADYNRDDELTPALDARFERLAEERIAAHPIRYYVWLPLGRVADMWLRPRNENLDDDLDWWAYAKHPARSRLALEYAGLNALYLLLGMAGVAMRPRLWPALVAYMLLRSAVLTNIAAPEARYTLECFPMLFAAGGVALSRLMDRPYLSKLKAVFGRA